MAGTLDQNADESFRRPPGTPKITFRTYVISPTPRAGRLQEQGRSDHVGSTDEQGGVPCLENEQIS